MKRRVLLVDNWAPFLETWADLLQLEGYDVLRAGSLDEARALLERRWIHALIIDVRMRDNDDEQDMSGLQLAQNAAYHAIPKIVLTAWPTVALVRGALGPLVNGLPAAVDFLDKNEMTIATLTEALDRAYATHLRINADLIINWGDQLSAHALASSLAADSPLDTLPELAQELEDLLRRLFCEYQQVELGRAFIIGDAYRVCEVFAFDGSGQDIQLMLTLGRRNAVLEERQRFQAFAPKGASSAASIHGGSETLRFAAVAYLLHGARLDELQPLASFYHSRPPADVAAVMDRLYGGMLAAWHRRGRAARDVRTATRGYLEWIEHCGIDLSADTLEPRMDAICDKISAAGFVHMVATPHAITITFSGHEQVSYAKPVIPDYSSRLPGAGSALYGATHGRVDLARVLVNDQGQPWLIDFACAGKGPVLEDFVLLEAALRFDTLDRPDLQVWHHLERQLLDLEQFGRLAEDRATPQEQQKTLAAISRIRSRAAQLPGDQLASYLNGLLLCCLARVATHDPQARYPANRLQPFAHALMLAAMIYSAHTRDDRADDRLPEAARNGLWFDGASEECWALGRRIDLGPQDRKLMALLYPRMNQMISRDDICKWVFDKPYSKSEEAWLNNAIDRLRDRIEPNPRQPRFLITIRGRGFKLVG